MPWSWLFCAPSGACATSPYHAGGASAETGRVPSGVTRLGECDLAEVDGDQQWLGECVALGGPGKDPGPGRNHDPGDLRVARHVVRARGAAHDVHVVVLAADEAVVTAESGEIFTRACGIRPARG